MREAQHYFPLLNKKHQDSRTSHWDFSPCSRASPAQPRGLGRHLGVRAAPFSKRRNSADTAKDGIATNINSKNNIMGLLSMDAKK